MPGEDVDQPVVRLEEYARGHASRRTHRRWVDRLPDEVVAQIVASRAGPSVVVAWLESLGFDGASLSKIKPLLAARDK